jgi:hypothetical protein
MQDDPISGATAQTPANIPTAPRPGGRYRRAAGNVAVSTSTPARAKAPNSVSSTPAPRPVEVALPGGGQGGRPDPGHRHGEDDAEP